MACYSMSLAPATVEIRGLGLTTASRQQNLRRTLRVKAEKSSAATRLVVSAKKEESSRTAQPTVLLSALTLAAAVLPDVADAAQPGVSPSLTNLLYSVLAGGVVLGGLGAAVVGVSLFDPVKRRT